MDVADCCERSAVNDTSGFHASQADTHAAALGDAAKTMFPSLPRVELFARGPQSSGDV
jgi:hypothetical protein